MSEKLIIPQVLTTPRPWGVQVEWKWPEGSHWFSKLEMQYLYSNGRLEKQVIAWPVTGKLIGGLKAGERLQIRLRPIDKEGAVRDWTGSDWIDGVSSSNAEEYLDAIGSDTRLMTTFSAPKFKIENGEVFINNAFIFGDSKAKEALKSKTSNDSIDVSKILDDAWKSGLPCVGEAVNDLAQAIANARACSQSYKQHTVGGETSTSTYSVSMHINCNDAQPVSGVDSNIDDIVKNALANVATEAARQAELTEKAMVELSEIVRKAIHKECLPGGLIWHQRAR